MGLPCRLINTLRSPLVNEQYRIAAAIKQVFVGGFKNYLAPVVNEAIHAIFLYYVTPQKSIAVR